MKMNKILAVLLSVVMLCAMIPAFTLTTSAAVGAITNGGFETGDFTGWDYYEHSSSVKKGDWTNSTKEGSYMASIGKDSSLAGHIALEQVVSVNKDATYKLSYFCKINAVSGNCSFSVSVELGNTPTSFSKTIVSTASPSVGKYSWTENTASFSTSEFKYARIRFNAKGSGKDTFLDKITLSATVVGDETTHAKPTLTKFGTDKNRPASSSDNVIVQPGFESTTNAQWNSTTFLANGVSVLEDSSIAHSGSKCLKYYRGNVAPTTWSYFDVALPAGGTYVFSAWVRTPGLSANNQGKASIGILDEKTGKFLCYGNAGGSYDGHYSNQEFQIRSTATDDDWHLRSVVFEIGGANTIKIAMYGLQSTMYVDDISIHLLSKGVKYEGNQTGTLSASKSSTNYYCKSEDNLIPDANMNGSLSRDFWSGAAGWSNGFLEIAKDSQNTTHGNTLHFKGTKPADNQKYRYVKFVPVEPNTKYWVTFEYRVVNAGSNGFTQLMFIDNNIIKNETFHTPKLTGNSWNTYTFSFNTGNYNRIGIVFQDSNEYEAYFDDFRFFKDSNNKLTTEPAEEVFPTLKHNKGDNNPVLESRMDTENNCYGLAFLFNLEADGVTVNNKYEGDYSNGTVDAFEIGDAHKLVAAGAVMTNDPNVGQNESLFKRENEGEVVNGKNTVVDVNAKYLLSDAKTAAVGAPEGTIAYAVRITNIPEKHKGTTIYARPYYVFQYGDQQVTVYGDIVYDAYEEIPDINDGWFEWD